MILIALIGIDVALPSSGFRSIRILTTSLDGVLGAGSGGLDFWQFSYRGDIDSGIFGGIGSGVFNGI